MNRITAVFASPVRSVTAHNLLVTLQLVPCLKNALEAAPRRPSQPARVLQCIGASNAHPLHPSHPFFFFQRARFASTSASTQVGAFVCTHRVPLSFELVFSDLARVPHFRLALLRWLNSMVYPSIRYPPLHRRSARKLPRRRRSPPCRVSLAAQGLV